MAVDRIGDMTTVSAHDIVTRIVIYADGDEVTAQIFTGAASVHLRMDKTDTEALRDLLTRSLDAVKNAQDGDERQRCAHGKTAAEPCGDCLADEGLDRWRWGRRS